MASENGKDNKKQSNTGKAPVNPLRRRFRLLLMPAFLLAAAIVVVLTGFAGWRVTEGIYLEDAERRAGEVDRALLAATPEPWQRLLGNEEPEIVFLSAEGADLLEELKKQLGALDLPRLDILRPDGVVLFSADFARIGTREEGGAFAAAAAGRHVIRPATGPDGTASNVILVPHLSASGGSLVFAFRRPVGERDALLVRTSGLAGLGAVAVLFLLSLAVDRLLARAPAPREADAPKPGAAAEKPAPAPVAEAADAPKPAAAEPSRKARVTLLHSDVRDFTGYSESVAAGEAIEFLDRIMGLQVKEIAAQDGRIDRMIGEALLARFEGVGAEARAIEAGREILEIVGAEPRFPRGLAVGIYSGEAISGTVGPQDRKGVTVVGESVALTARLAALAKRGELVVDAATHDAAKATGFDEPEDKYVKGRQGPLTVRRWRARV